MGSIIDLLALLDGWDYRVLTDTVAVQPNVVKEVFAERVPGWLLSVGYESTDAFANINVVMPPETFSILQTNLIELEEEGQTIPLAALPVLTVFDFPGLPGSSAGLGFMFMNLVYPLPLKKNNVIHIQFTLDPGTTQASASVSYEIVFAQIYEMKTFQQGLKDLFNVNKPPVL